MRKKKYVEKRMTMAELKAFRQRADAVLEDHGQIKLPFNGAPNKKKDEK